MNMQDIKSQSTIIHTDVRVYGGFKKLVADDFVEFGSGKLPPKELVDLGQERICPKDLLKKPNALRRKAERRLLRNGTRFIGSFLLANDDAEQALTDLQVYRDEFYAYLPEFEKRYWHGVLSWAKKFPLYKKAIISKAPAVEDIFQRMRFEIYAYRIGDLDNQSGTDTNTTVGNAFKGIYRDVIDETSQHIKDHVKGSLQSNGDTKRRIDQRTLKPFITVRDKLSSLSFIDYRFKVLVEYINQVITSMPSGKIEGADLARVLNLHQLLQSPAAMHSMIQALSE